MSSKQSSKQIFSLRLNKEVKSKLLEAADTQGTTITALITRYILSGLSKDNFLIESIAAPESQVVHPTTPVSNEDRTEELLFQVLQNQRHIISACDHLTQKKV